MAASTWIDTGANVAAAFGSWVSGQFASQQAARSFTPEQTAILRGAFEKCFEAFGRELGTSLASALSDMRQDLEQLKRNVEVDR